MKILVTGGTGFVGKALCPTLHTLGHEIVCSVRSENHEQIQAVTPFFTPSIDGNTDWKQGFDRTNVVIHLAGIAHVRSKNRFDLYDQFCRVNYAGTLNLAIQAARAGVCRFIFLSTIGVNGVINPSRKPFVASDLPAPHNAYAVSKLKGELALRKIEAKTGMEVVILRPPLVYGPHVKANFLRLMDLVASGIPLPFANVSNQKSFIGIDNLIDLIITCVNHGNAGGQTFLVSDNEDLSTPQLIRKIARAMGKRSILFPLPAETMDLSCRLLGQKQIYNQLWGDLRIDTKGICEKLKWSAPVSVDQGIERTVHWYLKDKKLRTLANSQ